MNIYFVYPRCIHTHTQSQLDDKDRTIRIQQDLIHKLEAEKSQTNPDKDLNVDPNIETVNMATQTDRVNIN